jgi:hypothetical protein
MLPVGCSYSCPLRKFAGLLPFSHPAFPTSPWASQKHICDNVLAHKDIMLTCPIVNHPKAEERETLGYSPFFGLTVSLEEATGPIPVVQCKHNSSTLLRLDYLEDGKYD